MNRYYYKDIHPFKWFVLENFPFIEADFDALTNWQLFCKIGKQINIIIDSQNEVGNTVETFTQNFVNLYNYVHDFFDNLDVQDEINHKLDEMVEDGTLESLLLNYANLIKVYDTTENMLLDVNSIIVGMKLKTQGYYTVNDEGGAEFYCRAKSEDDVIDNSTIYNVSETLVIEIIDNGIIKPEQLGAVGDGVANDTNAILGCTKFKNILMNKNYLTDSVEFTFENAIIDGNGKIINGVLITKNCIVKNITLKNTYRTAIALPISTTNNRCRFENITIDTTNLPSESSSYTAVGYGIDINSPNFNVVIKNCYFTKTTGIGAIYVQNDGYLDVDGCEFFDLGSRAIHIRENNVDGYFRNSKAHYLGVNYVETGRESVACGIYGHSTGNFKVLNNDIQYSVANCIEGRFTEVAGNYCAHTFVNMAYPNPTNSYQGVWLDAMSLPSIIHDNVFDDVSHSVSIGGNSNFAQGVEIYNNITNNTKSGYETFYVGNTPAKQNINIHDNPNSSLFIGNNSVVKTDILPVNISDQDGLNIKYIKRPTPKLYAYAPINCSNIPNIDFDSNTSRYVHMTINLPTYKQDGLLYLHFKARTTSSLNYINNGNQHNISSSQTGVIEIEKILVNNGTNSITLNGYFTELEIDFIEI